MKEKHVKYIAVTLTLMAVTAGLFLNIMKKTSDVAIGFGYPESGLKSTGITQNPGHVKEYLTMWMQCPVIPVMLALPEGTEVKNGMLIGTHDNISYIVAVCDENPEELLGDSLPRMVNRPVLGHIPEYEEMVTDTGYVKDSFYRYHAGYVETKISVRTLTEYVLAYCMEFALYEKELVFYASTEDKERLKEARDLLMDMMVSLEWNEEESEREETDIEIESNRESNQQLLSFLVDIRNDYILTDAVCVMNWTNITVEPLEIRMLDRGEVVSTPDQEYSYPGEYVFFFGNGEVKTYQLEGETAQPIENVEVHFMDRNDFMAYLEWQRDTADVIPHAPD